MKNWDRNHLKKHLYQNLASFWSHLQLVSRARASKEDTAAAEKWEELLGVIFFVLPMVQFVIPLPDLYI